MLVVGVVAALGCAGYAYASIPDSGTGTFHGCVLNNIGTIWLIDPSKSGLLVRCDAKLETAIAWNQQGQAGAKGDTGATGPAGSIQGAAAGGVLTGSYPNPGLADGVVTAAKLDSSGASAGDVLLAGSGGSAAWTAPPWQPKLANTVLVSAGGTPAANGTALRNALSGLTGPAGAWRPTRATTRRCLRPAPDERTCMSWGAALAARDDRGA
jgi:hypothetical protein